MMKKKINIILLAGLVLFILLAAAISAFTGIQVFAGSTQLVTNEGTKGVPDSFEKMTGISYEQFCNTYKTEELEISSSFGGHTIPADYIYAKDSENSKDVQTVILVHGLGGNRYSNYPLAGFFLEQGFNVITYDQRSSNENTARYTTFGYWEKYDLIDWINYVKEQDPGQKLGIWGTSFGGATAGLAMGYEDIGEKVDFLVLDCPVSSMKWMVEQEMRKMDIGLPISYMTWCGNVVNKLKLGFTYEDADVSRGMKNASMPVLIINSRQDEMTPYFMGKDIYDAISGSNKTIWTSEDSAHADIWFDYNEEYQNKVKELINQLTS